MIPKDQIRISTKTRHWTCIDSREEGNFLHYGRFVLAPLMQGQADTVGVAMRRALLVEVKGTCIIQAKLEVPHFSSMIMGVKEPAYDIAENLKKVILRSSIEIPNSGLIYVRGPKTVTAEDIILPPYIKIVNKNQHIATVKESRQLFMRLTIERKRAFYQKIPYNLDKNAFFINPTAPVLNANYSVHSYKNPRNEKEELLFLEIWTNGGVTPKAALEEASLTLLNLLGPPFQNKDLKEEESKDDYILYLSALGEREEKKKLTFHERWEIVRERAITTKIVMDKTFVELFHFSPRVYYLLKMDRLNALSSLVELDQQNLLSVFDSVVENAEEVAEILYDYLEEFERDGDFY